ncbi:MAG: 50S ribosomal protein L11 methyltransferase [Planctomycetes bacterium]|nr:50S ribosomal protein L11 methyltransferase [Planctomycetota bacterium]
MDNYLKPYGEIELHRRMVSDRSRTNAFAAAIREVVQPGHVVLDVGTGTGILAMFAAKAGARKVYAVDATDIAEVAADLVQANGLSDQIQVIHGRADEVRLDQKVDLIVSEWLGSAAFVEGMLHAVLDARDQNLAPAGRMLPSGVRVLIAPLDDPILYDSEGPGFWRQPIDDLDFSSLQEAELLQGRTTQIRIEPPAVLAPGQALLELDLLTASVEDVWFEGQLAFVPARDGVLNGFGVWFEAELSPSVLLDTGPFSPETHWSQTYLPFTPRPVRAGEPVAVSVDFSYAPDAATGHVALRLGVGEHELSYTID